MRTIKIFLASSNELKAEREAFEIQINRRNKVLTAQGVFLHLDIWEDLPAHMSRTSSQDEYNAYVKAADIVVLLVWTKMGMYSDIEFETAYKQFIATDKPFIFTYFKITHAGHLTEPSLDAFKQKLVDLKHFRCEFDHFDSLWNQFGKELERLHTAGYDRNDWNGATAPQVTLQKNVITNSTLTAHNGSIIVGDGNTINM